MPGQRGQGELHLQLIYKAFEDDDDARSSAGSAGSAVDAEAFAFARADSAITDVRSAAGARSVHVGTGIVNEFRGVGSRCCYHRFQVRELHNIRNNG